MMIGEERGEKVFQEVFSDVLPRSLSESKAMVRDGESSSLVKDLFGLASSTLHSGGMLGKDAIKETTGMVKDLASGLGGFGADLFNTVGDLGQSVLGGIKDMASSISSKQDEAVNGKKDEGGGGEGGGTPPSGEGGGTPSGEGGGGTPSGEGGGEGQSAFGGIMDMAKDVGGSMFDCAMDLGSGLVDTVGSVVDAAMDMGGAVAEGLMDFAGSAWDAAKDFASGVGDAIGDMLGLGDEEVEDMMDDIDEYEDEMYDDFDEDMEEAEEEVEETMDEMEDEMESLDDEMDPEDWDDDWMEDEEDEEDEEEEYDEDYEDWEDWEDWVEEPEDNDAVNDDPPVADEPSSSQQPTASGQEDQKTPSQQTSIPMGNDPPPDDTGMSTIEDKAVNIGWKSIPTDVVKGIVGMMHDGDQQLFNPYGPSSSYWTMYSFRPSDAKKTWPQIAITPSSFEAIRSMNTMLDRVPYIVVKEYFFKNVASTMIDFVKKMQGLVKNAFEKSTEESPPAEVDANEESSKGNGNAKSTGNKMLDKVKEVFHNIPLKHAVIDIPYVLYAGLRQRQYGNTYIFPYIVNSGTTINEASNESEWEKGNNGGLSGIIKGAMEGVTKAIASFASATAGSDARGADLFPAPTWGGPKAGNVSFEFDLVLINDNIVKARNNYMCVNTIIHNNRSIQKAILAFPGALYEVWLPTGQRHLMCTGTFKLSPLGLNRMTPNNFFSGMAGFSGADFAIGANQAHVAMIQNPENKGHRENQEVLPDAYKLSITFKSCLANNMNTAVFQYYVAMAGYDDAGLTAGETEDGSALTRGVYKTAAEALGQM